MSYKWFSFLLFSPVIAVIIIVVYGKREYIGNFLLFLCFFFFARFVFRNGLGAVGYQDVVVVG